MSRNVIVVENLGKRYRLHHQERERYSTLRDTLARRAKSLFRDPRAALRTGQTDEDFWALKDVSFEIKEGEVVGIIGRNGAGKSTLLKILSRITEPTTGRVGIRGRVASLLEVGTGFHPELTGRENIFLNGAVLGMSREEIKRKFDEIVAFAEIEKFLDTPVKRYSSGMYVRLAFAVAAHLEPEILIVDEVLAVGDAEFQKKCLGKMGEVAGSGRTIFFVSHNTAAITTLTTRVVLLEKGNPIFDGPTLEGIKLYSNRANQNAKQYIAKPNRNRHQIVEISLPSLINDGIHISGENLTIQIITRSEEKISQGCLSVQIVNENLQPVLHLRAYDHQVYFGQKTGNTTFTCTVPNCSLNIGRYTITAYLSGPPGGDFYEHVESACTFNVEIHNQIAMWGWRSQACAYITQENWRMGLSA